MEKHFVTFLSPGTLFAENQTVPIESWDFSLAQKMSANVMERYNATPYAFYFTTRTRSDEELDSKVATRSPTYYLPHCRVMTLEELKSRHDPKDGTLITNMECNGYQKVVMTVKGWKWTQSFEKGDVLLES